MRIDDTMYASMSLFADPVVEDDGDAGEPEVPAADVRVGQINLKKSKIACTELARRSERYDIFLIQEPHLSPRGVTGVTTMNCNRAGHARAAVLTGKNLETWPVPEFTTKDLATVAVLVQGQPSIYVASVYLDITKNIALEEWIALIGRCKDKNIPLVMGIDSNAHSPMWGGEESNRRGEQLEELILQWDLVMVNERHSPATFDNDRGGLSHIDLTLCNQLGSERLRMDTWHVIDESAVLTHTDHKYIQFVLGSYVPRRRLCRNLRTADWDDFRGKLTQSCATKSDDPDAEARDIQESISMALEQMCPKKPVRSRKPNPWWTPELDELRKDMQAAGRKRKQNLLLLVEYKKRRAKYYKAISRCKRRSWQEFCSNLSSVTEVSRLTRILEGKSSSRQIGILKENGRYVDSPEDALRILLDTHFPDHQVFVEHGGKASLVGEDGAGADEKEVTSFIDGLKVRSAFMSFGPKKAPGPDELTPVVLQNLPTEMYDRIAKLYRRVIGDGYTPMCWREMKVVFIPKSSKDDYGLAKAYRPITLSNFMLKGLERIIQWLIGEKFITEPLPNQHAYTPGLSTETALMGFANMLEKNLMRGKKLLAVSLDCSGAFDKIKFDSAAEAMVGMELPRKIVSWYDYLLRHRCVTADVQGVTKKICPGRGSPQGGGALAISLEHDHEHAAVGLRREGRCTRFWICGRCPPSCRRTRPTHYGPTDGEKSPEGSDLGP